MTEVFDRRITFCMSQSQLDRVDMEVLRRKSAAIGRSDGRSIGRSTVIREIIDAGLVAPEKQKKPMPG